MSMNEADTPRKLEEFKHASADDQEITANNRKYFGEPVYEYTLIQAQEDGYRWQDWVAPYFDKPEHPKTAEGKPFPSYARMLAQRGKPEGASRYSWTVDFAARRAKTRAEMQPMLDDAAQIKATVVDLKEQLKRLKKDKASDAELLVLVTQILEKEKAARDLETKAADIDAAVFDLKAVNPTAVVDVDTRAPQQIIENIAAQGRIVADALVRLNSLMDTLEVPE